MTAAGWERFEVDGGVGVRGWGASRAESFVQVTLGVLALLVAPDEVQAHERREVRAQAGAPGSLLVAWIDECLYVLEIEGFVAREVELTVCTDTLAHGVLHGEPFEARRHRAVGAVKSAKRGLGAVELRGEMHEARIVVDV